MPLMVEESINVKCSFVCVGGVLCIGGLWRRRRLKMFETPENDLELVDYEINE